MLHNDRIGSFRIAKGKYRITLLSYRGVSCQRAVSLFQRFLQDYDGVLPRPWLLDPGTGTFTRGHRHVGFRIKPYVSEGSGQGGSQGRHPSGGQSKCPATFRVVNNDSIGALRLKKGNYNVWSGLSCPRSIRVSPSSSVVSGVLPLPGSSMPTGTFRRGTSLPVSRFALMT